MDRTRIILNRCRESSITISKKKLEMGRSIQFAGHIVSDTGIRPDEEKYSAIRNFPRPKNVTDLRSFLGLANQMASFLSLIHI